MIKTKLKTIIPSLFINVQLYFYKNARCKDKFIYLEKRYLLLEGQRNPLNFLSFCDVLWNSVYHNSIKEEGKYTYYELLLSSSI